MAELRVERTIVVDAPPERVFERWANPDTVPAWRHAIRAIDREEPLDRAGARFRIHWSGRFEGTEGEILRYEPASVHEVAVGGRRKYVATASFDSVDGVETALRLQLKLAVPLLLAPLFRVRLNGEMDGELERFRAFAEDGSRAG